MGRAQPGQRSEGGGAGPQGRAPGAASASAEVVAAQFPAPTGLISSTPPGQPASVQMPWVVGATQSSP